MPTWSVECTDARSVKGKPESTICTYSAEPFEFLDISCVLMSLTVERLTAHVLPRDRFVVSVLSLFGSTRSVPPIPEEWNHLVISLSNLELIWSQHSRMSTVSLAGSKCAFKVQLANCHLLTSGPSGSESTMGIELVRASITLLA